MSSLPDAVVAAIPATVQANVEAVAHSLKSCFGQSYQLTVEDASAADAAPFPAVPGLIVVLQAGSQAILLGIPQTLPLPDWYRKPGDSESARLQTLAMESSLNLVPDDCEIEKFVTIAVEDLAAAVGKARPASTAQHLCVAVDGSTAKLHLTWPVDDPQAIFPRPEPEPVPAPQPVATGPTASNAPARPRDKFAAAAALRLGKVKVRASVRLAEKRIEMGQLLAINPGALITFNKSCEDLLDLYVNNVLLCRGEAVKIGEKFGLKINEMSHGRRKD